MLSRVVVFPSWFPNKVQPLFGSFVQDQVLALASTYPNVEWHVVAPDAPPEWLSLRKPIAGVASYVRARRSPSSRVQKNRNIHLHRVRALQGSHFLGLVGHAPYKSIIKRTLRQIERKFGTVDLIHVHGCFPAGLVISALRPACPWVMTEHQSPFPFVELRNADGSLWPELRDVFRKASAPIAVSRSHALEIEQFTGVRPVVIPNVCDESLFRPRASRPDGPFTFLTVGGLNEQKGIDVLLNAIAEFRSRGQRAHFRIVGAGLLGEKLQAQARALGLEDIVEWCGAISREELPNVFRSADAFVLPSRHESFGVGYIEALASGIPIIATRCGGPEDIVQPGNGALVPVEDHHALADALGAMVVADYKPAVIRQDFIDRFSTAPVCRQIMNLYESVS